MLQDWSHPAFLIPGDAACTVFTSWVQPISPQRSPGDVPWTARAHSKDGTEAESESKWAAASGPVCALTSTRTWLIRLHIPHNPSVPSLPLWWPHLFPQNCSHSHANPSPDAEDSPSLLPRCSLLPAYAQRAGTRDNLPAAAAAFSLHQGTETHMPPPLPTAAFTSHHTAPHATTSHGCLHAPDPRASSLPPLPKHHLSTACLP